MLYKCRKVLLNKRVHILIVCCTALILCILAPMIGMAFINPFSSNDATLLSTIFYQIRLPRLFTGMCAGAGLALAGMVFQAMFRNPLATPDTLGVSSGASLGAAITVLAGLSGNILGIPIITLGAFLGSMAAISLVYMFSSIQKTFSNITMLLAGVATSLLFSSLLMFAQYLSSMRNSFQIVRWLMGGIDVFGYSPFFSMFPLVALAALIILVKSPVLNLLLTGEDIAQTRGVAVGREKIILFFATSLMVSAIVSVCGPIGFIGLMAPHMCRILFGNDHRLLVWMSMIFGGTFLVVCDTIARVIVAPAEMPVGVITALLGGPFFLILLLGQVRGNGRPKVF